MFEKRDELLDAVDHACFQCVHMAKPFRLANSNHPALAWELSDKAKQEIKEIELNAGTALQRIGRLVVD